MEANLMVISNLQGQEAHISVTPCWLNGHGSHVDKNTKWSKHVKTMSKRS